MKFEVSTTIKGMLFTEPEKVIPVFNKEFTRGLNESVATVQAETVMRTPVSLGFLRRSIGTELKGEGLNLEGIVGTPIAYAMPVELGAQPHFPPIGPIELWVKRTSNLSYIMTGVEITAQQLAYLIARKISATGLKAHWMFRDGLQASATKINKFLQAAQTRIIATVNG